VDTQRTTLSRILGTAILPLAALALLFAWRLSTSSAHDGPLEFVKVTRSLMGTVWNIEVTSGGRVEQAQGAIESAYAELKRIDSVMSEWRPDSPISKVDAAAGKSAVEVPEELRAMLERSIEYSRQTQGTFDVTWRGMGHLWHFDDSFQPPSAFAVEQARRRINYRAIRIEGDRVYLPQGMSIGLGGIAKGYAVDRAIETLARAGFHDALVDGGGDVRVSGTRAGEPWRLGIQHPREAHGKLLGLVRMTGGALATSGDYERFRIVNGVRYHHIIDPRTGWPANASISVSVLANSAEQAVVLAKGVFILGPEEGIALAKRLGVEALLIDPRGKPYMTEGFARRMETSWQ
jgi:thiamine biosynthesis lipoprotein